MPAFPGGTPFTPNKCTPFLYSTLQDACWGQLVHCRNASAGTGVTWITPFLKRLLGQADFNNTLWRAKSISLTLGAASLLPPCKLLCGAYANPLIQLRYTLLTGPDGWGNWEVGTSHKQVVGPSTRWGRLPSHGLQNPNLPLTSWRRNFA